MDQPIGTYFSSLKYMAKPLFKQMLFASLYLYVIAGITFFFNPPKREIPLLEYFLIALVPITLFMLLFLVLMLIFYAMKYVFPVKVFHEGIRCYDTFAIYHSVKWGDIQDSRIVVNLGLPYLYIKVKGLKREITLPLYLDNMGEFSALIKKKDKQGNLALWL